VKRWFSFMLLMVIAVIALYSFVETKWSYSTGERAGWIQKFSRKGWLCKTWEGEMAMVTMPGTIPEKFDFTVWEPNVVQQINESMGRRVSLSYEQKKGLPSNCFGETEYWITAVRVLPDTLPLPGIAPAPAPTPLPPSPSTGGPASPPSGAAPAPSPAPGGPASPPSGAAPPPPAQ
jgi:hypothetical protein